jgi:hypothetical protein
MSSDSFGRGSDVEDDFHPSIPIELEVISEDDLDTVQRRTSNITPFI